MVVPAGMVRVGTLLDDQRALERVGSLGVKRAILGDVALQRGLLGRGGLGLFVVVLLTGRREAQGGYPHAGGALDPW